MTNTAVAPVVAGVDGSADAQLAVDLAAWEADRRHATLRLVYGFQPVYVCGVATIGYDLDRQVRDLDDMLVAESARVARRYPDLPVATEVVQGAPASGLLDESAAAQLVVVGSRGRGGFASLLLGSVSAQVAAYATSPVIVMRPPAARGAREIPGKGPVVLGIDGSTGSAAAVEFAFDEAAARGTALIAVYPWGLMPVDTALADALAAWQDKYPEVPVSHRAIHSLVPVHTILDRSTGAGLIVVAPGGSIGDSPVRHANAPVAVVHTHHTTTS